uniref:Uncharacterized protein n=1 Tax=Schistocephalus solidus TaxID=70667 RepID=A0A0X3NVE8_SCHSO
MLTVDKETFNEKPPLPKARRHSLREVMKVTAEKPFENTADSSATRPNFNFSEQNNFEESSSATEEEDSASEEDGDEFEELQLSCNSLQASRFRFDGDSEDLIPKLLANESTSSSFEKWPTFTPERQTKGSPAAQLPLSGPNPCTASGQVPFPMEALPLTKSLEGLKAAAATGDILAQWRFRRRMEGSQMSLLPLSGFCSQQHPPELLQPAIYPPRYANFPTVPLSHIPLQTHQQPVPASYSSSPNISSLVLNNTRSCGCNNFSSAITGLPNTPGPSLAAPRKVVLRETSVQYESNDVDQSSGRGPKTTSKSSETPKWMIEKLLVKSVRSVAIQRGSEKGNKHAGALLARTLSKNQTDAAVQCAEQPLNAEPAENEPAQDSSSPPNRLPCLITQVVRQHLSYDRSRAGNNVSNVVWNNSPQRNAAPSTHADDSSTWPTPISSPLSSITPIKSSCDSGRSIDFTNAAARKGPFGDWIQHRLSTGVDAPDNVASADFDLTFSEDVILQQLRAARDNCARKLRLVEEAIQRKQLGDT